MTNPDERRSRSATPQHGHVMAPVFVNADIPQVQIPAGLDDPILHPIPVVPPMPTYLQRQGPRAQNMQPVQLPAAAGHMQDPFGPIVQNSIPAALPQAPLNPVPIDMDVD